jgi:tRNA 2-selenouridine synthase
LSSSSLDAISSEQLLQLLLNREVHVIDVRAPVEFFAGKIPGSVNLPLLTDEERALVGTAYKQQGSEEAIALGHRLVSGPIKEARIKAWLEEIGCHPGLTVVTCFRGGLRSQTVQHWLQERGYSVPRLAGGYKKMRQQLTAEIFNFCHHHSLYVLTGKTGAGKTKLLRSLSWNYFVDLEALAHHRGSAFGNFDTPQPSQVDFENHLALALSRLHHHRVSHPVLVEDESRMIGRCVQPESFFHLLRNSPVLVLEESLESRVENTFQEYVLARIHDTALFSNLRISLLKIKSKLGGLRYQELLHDMQQAEDALRQHGDASLSRVWIEKLLVWYYDPAYEKSLSKRNPKVSCRGSSVDIKSFIERH